MIKGLEALEKVKEIIREDAEDIDNPRLLVDEIYLIEKELKDYDLLKRSLNRNWVEVVNDEKKLKALEIIKEKRVNVDNFLNRIKSCTSYEEYKTTLCERYRILVISDKELTKEEYDLLKEILL